MAQYCDWLMGWKMHGFILGRGKRFSPYPKCLGQPWDQPNSIGTGDFCPMIK